jgi:hypothetical protein
MEAVLAVQEGGKLRYIGFTGHKDPVVHLRMLEVACGAMAGAVGHARDACGLEDLGQAHRRQDGGKPARQHRLPRPTHRSRCVVALSARRRPFSRSLLRRQVVPRDVAHNESVVPVSPLIMSGLGDSRRNGDGPDAL